MAFAIAAVLWIVATAAVTALLFRREIVRAWREPVLTAPVLIVESDDWGYGPHEQADALRRIAALLATHRDGTGQPAVMTLGVVLAGPDTARIAAQGCRQYYRLTLADIPLAEVRNAMLDGTAHGVFALQLHGLEHYWPSILIAAAQTDAGVRNWLTSEGLPRTESLSARFQSRWIDASTLPSRPLGPEEIRRAVREEIDAFRSVFAMEPEVVVPPTFVWDTVVEQAWAQGGLRWLVTPGRRNEGRDADGRPMPVEAVNHNGERGLSGLTHVVRDQYFEPILGHSAERALAALQAKTQTGRPTLLETHRANFIGGENEASRALAELDRMLGAARERFANLRFMSTADLGRHYRDGSALLEHRVMPRLHCFVSRLAESTRLRKLAWATGLVAPAALLWAVTRASRGPGASRRPHVMRSEP